MKSLIFTLVVLLMSLPSWAKIIEVDSLEVITPEADKEVLGKVNQSVGEFGDIRNVLGDLLWGNQEELSQSVYDEISKFTLSTELVEGKIDNKKYDYNLNFETTFDRNVYLDGPLHVNEEKFTHYYEVSSFHTRLVGSLRNGFGSSALDFGVDGRGAAGLSFHYAKKTPIFRMREFLINKKIDKVTGINSQVCDAFGGILGSKTKKGSSIGACQEDEEESKNFLVKSWHKVINGFEKGIQALAKPFVDSDKGEALFARISDPIRLPTKLININGEVMPIDYRTVKEMDPGDMLFLTTYLDGGAGISGSKGITTISVNKSKRLAYHAALRKLEGNVAELRVKLVENNTLDLPRIQAQLKERWGALKLKYKFGHFVYTEADGLISEYVYRYNLINKTTIKAFERMLLGEPEFSEQAVLNKSGTVTPIFTTNIKSEKSNEIIGQKTTTYDTSNLSAGLSLPGLFDQTWRKSVGTSRSIFKNVGRTAELGRYEEGHFQYIRGQKYRFFSLKDSQRRGILGKMSINTDKENRRKKREDTNLSQSEVSVRYNWQDSYTSKKEFQQIKRFLNYLVGDISTLQGNVNFKKFMNQNPKKESYQNFNLTLSFSQDAVERILKSNPERIWQIVGEKIFKSNVWQNKAAREDWKSDLEVSELCDSSGFLSGIVFNYPECESLYLTAEAMVKEFIEIQKAALPGERVEYFNQVATTVGEHPALAYIMLKLNMEALRRNPKKREAGDLTGVKFELSLRGSDYDGLPEIIDGDKFLHSAFNHVSSIPAAGDFRDTTKTIRNAEVFLKKSTKQVVLALETNRRINKGDALFFDLYLFKPFISDKMQKRYKVRDKGLFPMPLSVKDGVKPDDMSVARYRYEVVLPQDFSVYANKVVNDTRFKKSLTFQYLFMNNSRSMALSEVGEVMFKPKNAK